MKNLKDIILEKLIINKNIKINSYEDIKDFRVIIAFNKHFNKLKRKYKDSMVAPPIGNPICFILHKDDIQAYKDKLNYIDGDLRTYLIPEKYKTIEEFKEDWIYNDISKEDLKTK